MAFGSMGGGGIGAAIGRAAGKATKPRSIGRKVGTSVSRTTGRSSSGSSNRRRVSNNTRSSVNRNYGGGGNSGGGGGGGRSIQPAPRPKPVAVPSLAQYLAGDSGYQNVVRGGKRSLADFLSEIGRRRGEAGTQFNQTKASMERDRVTQLEQLRNEFASRGLIQSGLYGEEQGRFQQQFTEQQTALQQQQAALLSDLMSQQTNFKREQDLALEAAKQEALARRAAKYKIGA